MYSRTELTTTNVAPAFRPNSSPPELMTYCLEGIRVETIVEIIVSVLPRPITSARMPPAAYEGMLERELFGPSARNKTDVVSHHFEAKGQVPRDVQYVGDVLQPLVHGLTVAVGLAPLDELERSNLVARTALAATATS